MCTILVLSGTTSRSLECSRIGGESTSGKNGPIRIEDEDFFSTLEAKHFRSKNTKKLKRENVESSYRWSILEQLSNIRGVSRATRTEHVYIFNRTVRSSGLKYGYGSLTFFSREWQMRMAGAPHHTNPRSATLDFWRKTTPYEQYKIIQARVPMTKWCAAHITGPW